MQELKFKNFAISAIIFIIAIAASIGVSYIKMTAFNLPIPLLVIGLFAGFLVLSFVCYSKATTVQTIQLTIAGVCINAVVFVAAVFGIKFLKVAEIAVDSDFILSINPLVPALSFLFSFAILMTLIKLEDKTSKKIKQTEASAKAEEPKAETISVPDEPKVELKPALKPEPNFEPRFEPRVEVQEEIKEEKIELSEKVEEIKEEPKSVYEELYPQAQTPAPVELQQPEEEFLFDLKEEQSLQEPIQEQTEEPLFEEIHEEPSEELPDLSLDIPEETDSTSFFEEEIVEIHEEKKEEVFIELEELPSLSLEAPEEIKETSIFKEESPIPPEEKIEEIQEEIVEENAEENFDFIPADIRLVDAPSSKENDSKGKIASIGKLLVNKRDIEGVLEASSFSETNADSKTSVLSSESGEQIYEKFNTITQAFTQIKEIALIDKGGFIMACNTEDKMKMNTIGAVISGAYHTLQNYLAQITFRNVEKIFFETENSNNFIMKTDDNILYSTWDKSFKHIEFGELQDFIEQQDVTEADFISLIELGQIKNFAISDALGKITTSANKAAEAQKQGMISTAVFENLKVFLMNIQLFKLRRITIFNANEVLIIQKFDDKTVSFKTELDGMVKISDNFKKIEEIY